MGKIAKSLSIFRIIPDFFSYFFLNFFVLFRRGDREVECGQTFCRLLQCETLQGATSRNDKCVTPLVTDCGLHEKLRPSRLFEYSSRYQNGLVGCLLLIKKSRWGVTGTIIDGMFFQE